MSLARIRQCKTCHADAALTKVTNLDTCRTRYVVTCPSLCKVRSASTPDEAVARWNAANPAPDAMVIRCGACNLSEPHECLAGGEYRRGESVIHDGRKWT